MTAVPPLMSCPRCGNALATETSPCRECDPVAQQDDVGTAKTGTVHTSAQVPVGATDTESDLRLTPAQLSAAPKIELLRGASGPWGRPSEPPGRLSPVPAEAAPAAETAENNSGEDKNNEEDDADDGTPEPLQISVRAPILASVALRRDLFPVFPGGTTVRSTASSLGLLGAMASTWLLPLNLGGLSIVAGFIALGLLGVAPIAPLARATSLSALSALGLGASVLMIGTQLGPPTRFLALLATTMLLSLGLHYRAWHRASALARVLVALGIAAGVAWLATAAGDASVSGLDGNYRIWLPQVFMMPFGLLLMLSLLAFMDGRTTGGCGTWAAGVWCWFAGYILTLVVAETSTAVPILQTLKATPIRSLCAISTAMLAPIFIQNMTQILASTMSQRHGGTTAG